MASDSPRLQITGILMALERLEHQQNDFSMYSISLKCETAVCY